MDRTFSFGDKFDPLIIKDSSSLKVQLWRHLRTNLKSAVTSRKMKMFYLVDTRGKELAECLEKATADGKSPQEQYSYKMHGKMKLHKLMKF